MGWRDEVEALKNGGNFSDACETPPPKLTKPSISLTFDSFVSVFPRTNEKSLSLIGMNPWLSDRAWNELQDPAHPWVKQEREAFEKYEALAVAKLWNQSDAQSIAEVLLYRDRTTKGMHSCLECAHNTRNRVCKAAGGPALPRSTKGGDIAEPYRLRRCPALYPEKITIQQEPNL